jgi:hypothetical protein
MHKISRKARRPNGDGEGDPAGLGRYGPDACAAATTPAGRTK